MHVLDGTWVPPPEPPTCKNCRLQLNGLCRRYPSVAFEWDTRNSYGDPIKETIWAQPNIDLTNWCGEHKP